jgi:hypothetical protein
LERDIIVSGEYCDFFLNNMSKHNREQLWHVISKKRKWALSGKGLFKYHGRTKPDYVSLMLNALIKSLKGKL